MDIYVYIYISVEQELIVIDDLLSVLVGIEGRYISIKRVRGKVDSFSFQVDTSMDLALQVGLLVEFSSCRRLENVIPSGFSCKCWAISCH